MSGIDLTAEFCDVARHLTAQLGLTERIAFEQGDALAMPFDDAAFDGAYTMNVSMNIADSARSSRRSTACSRLARGSGCPRSPKDPAGRRTTRRHGRGRPRRAFLATPAETYANLEASGFTIESRRDTAEAALAYAAHSRTVVDAGGKPPHRAVALVHGDIAEEAMANTGRALKEGCTIPIEVICRKADP